MARRANVLMCRGFLKRNKWFPPSTRLRGGVSMILRLRSSLWAVGGAITVDGPCESERQTTTVNEVGDGQWGDATKR